MAKIKKPLTRRQKGIIAVCKDVVKQLNAKKVRASHTYVDLPFDISDAPVVTKAIKRAEDTGYHVPVSLQELLKHAKRPCRACAIGSAFLSHVKLNNKFNLNVFNGGLRPYLERGIDNDEMRKAMEKTFGYELLSKMEAAFEMRGTLRNKLNEEDYGGPGMTVWIGSRVGKYGERINYQCAVEAEPYCRFGYKYKSDEKRLRAIMENIIYNKGDFNPARHPKPKQPKTAAQGKATR